MINRRIGREIAIVAIAAIAPYTAVVIVITLLVGWWSLLVAVVLGGASALWCRQDKLAATRVRLFVQAVTEKDAIS